VHIFHAGTKKDATGAILTAGGRVLNVVGTGDTIAQARKRAYQAAEQIHFPGMVIRRDIAANAPELAARP